MPETGSRGIIGTRVPGYPGQPSPHPVLRGQSHETVANRNRVDDGVSVHPGGGRHPACARWPRGVSCGHYPAPVGPSPAGHRGPSSSGVVEALLPPRHMEDRGKVGDDGGGGVSGDP